MYPIVPIKTTISNKAPAK